MEIVFYVDDDGTKPFQKWLSGLDHIAVPKIRTAIRRMQDGNLSKAKSVGNGVMEYRLDWGPGYRLYFGRHGHSLIVLLGGGTKSRQQEDISLAKLRWDIHKTRNRGG